MNIKWNEYTWYSKWGSLAFFLVAMPILSFYIGIKHQQTRDEMRGLLRSAEGLSATQGLRSPQEPAVWETYVNDKYGYSFEHPSWKDLDANTNRTSGISIEPIGDLSKSGNLRTFAQLLWKNNKEDPNPNFPNKIVSSLEQIEVSGRPAYVFSLNESFSYGDGGGYVLSGQNTYVVAENQNHDFFLIHFPSNDDAARKIFSTLRIDGALIAPKVAAADWKRYEDEKNGFSFSYPSNIFSKSERIMAENEILIDGARGSILVTVSDMVLDPNHIQDKGGEIENPTKVMIGNRTGYQIGYGDAGCMYNGLVVPVDGNSKTLQVTFNSCMEDLYPIGEDTKLQSAILSTFKFTK